MDLQCVFRRVQVRPKLLFYTSIITEAEITETSDDIRQINGDHHINRNHCDVECVNFINTIVQQFPRSVALHFPNLTRVDIRECNLEVNNTSDLEHFASLESLRVEDCMLSTLPDDLFTSVPMLYEVFFRNNRLLLQSGTVFQALVGRLGAKVDHVGNANVNVRYWPGCSDSLTSLDELIRKLDEIPLETHLAVSPYQHDPLKTMWLAGIGSNFLVTVSGEKIPVIKGVLQVSSGAFRRFFQQHPHATEYEVTGYAVTTVKAMLGYMHTSQLQMDTDFYENYKIADAYQVLPMVRQCEEVLVSLVTDSNAWDSYNFAHRVKSSLLKAQAYYQIITRLGQSPPQNLIEDPGRLGTFVAAYDELQQEKEKVQQKKEEVQQKKEEVQQKKEELITLTLSVQQKTKAFQELFNGSGT